MDKAPEESLVRGFGSRGSRGADDDRRWVRGWWDGGLTDVDDGCLRHFLSFGGRRVILGDDVSILGRRLDLRVDLDVHVDILVAGFLCALLTFTKREGNALALLVGACGGDDSCEPSSDRLHVEVAGVESFRDPCLAVFAGEPETRSTVHLVTPEVDVGPALVRSWPFPVHPMVDDARRWGAIDILKAYAYAQREWMMRAAWGPMLRKAIALLEWRDPAASPRGQPHSETLRHRLTPGRRPGVHETLQPALHGTGEVETLVEESA